MKRLRPSRPHSRAILCTLALLLTGSALVAARSGGQEPQEPTPATAREEIDARYNEWERARVEYDREKMETILAPEFHVLLDGREISREKFISDVSQKRSDGRLTRFEADILTVQRTEQGWTVVITEKLEFDVTGPDGETKKVYSFWVTRDGFRREEGQWLVTFSEAIGHENWLPGTEPPFENW